MITSLLNSCNEHMQISMNVRSTMADVNITVPTSLVALCVAAEMGTT